MARKSLLGECSEVIKHLKYQQNYNCLVLQLKLTCVKGESQIAQEIVCMLLYKNDFKLHEIFCHVLLG